MRASFIASLVGLVLAHGAAQFQVKAADLSRLSLVGTHITDNGDGDGIADSNETVQIGISVQSHGGTLRDCVAWLSTESPAVDCMRKSEILIGDVSGSGPAVTPVERFEITFGNVDRHDLGLGPDDPLEALLTLDIRCSYGSSTLRIREPLRLSLDLNVLDQGQTPVTWEGDFEAGGINPAAPLEGTAFHAQNIDAGLPGNDNAEGLINSDDWRCQYSDPDWRNSSSYNNEWGMDCYPGMDLAQADAVFWQVDGSLEPDSPDGGRAHRGEKSMYYGVFLGQYDNYFGTPRATVESAATHDLINLGANGPQLSFWQQISLIDHRAFNAYNLRSIDGGVVQILLHDSAGNRIKE